jgi:hypothetical protein
LATRRRKSARKKSSRRTPPLRVAHQIADRLVKEGIHGRFTVTRYEVDETEWTKPDADFFWLKSANPSWIEFVARFNRRSLRDIEDAETIGKAFLAPLIKGGYVGRSIAMVKTVIGDDEEGDTIEDWRSLTVTLRARATLGQVGDATRRWMNKPEYQAVAGFSIRIEL